MVEKVHGTSFSGEFLTKNMDFFTVRTLVDIRPSATKDPNEASQVSLDKLVETISTRAQPVILGGVTVSSETDPSDLPAASGTVDVYTLKFAVEHAGAWNPTELAETLDGVDNFVFTTPTTNNNVAVTQHETL